MPPLSKLSTRAGKGPFNSPPHHQLNPTYAASPISLLIPHRNI